MNALTFHNTTLTPVPSSDGTVWLGVTQIGLALGYADDKAIQRIYARHSGEFTERMTGVVKLTTPSGKQETRIFSLRGAHLLAMFSRTPVASEFRRWVLDVLDAQVCEPQPCGLVVLDKHEVTNLAGLLGQLRASRDVQMLAEQVLRAAGSPFAGQMHDAWAEPALACSLLDALGRRCRTALTRQLMP